MKQLQSNEILPPRALLIAAYFHPREALVTQDHLEELKMLADTMGAVPVHSEAVYLRSIDPGTFITSGKLEELALLADELKVDFVLVDEEISPAQGRNLEAAFKRRVMDRSEVILEVFAARAQTKEAKLQIELARERYMLPRLKRLWTHLSRQQGSGGSGGGGAYLKGEGEKQIEIDRQLIKAKIVDLEKQIDEVKTHRETQRQKRMRSSLPIFSIVGYTNAGKSTLLKAVSGADVFIENKLFATLDTTTRQITLPNNQEALVIDTVGFIRKLPHLLVAAFKSTLEESLFADILLHVVDVSHPSVEEQVKATLTVLEELGAGEKPVITVFNKCDLLEDKAQLAKLRIQLPKNVVISALTHEGFDDLYAMMMKEVQALRQRLRLRIPQEAYGKLTKDLNRGRVLEIDYEDNDVLVDVELPKQIVDLFKEFEVKETAQ